jgi:phosphoribosylglycinamide formyltransferase 2
VNDACVFTGKPMVDGSRRVAVTLARADTIELAREKARRSAAALAVDLV